MSETEFQQDNSVSRAFKVDAEGVCFSPERAWAD